MGKKKRKTHHNEQNWKSWASYNYNEAMNGSDKLTTKEACKYLGISEYMLRKYFYPTEWHHAYKKYGDYSKAYFWDKSDLMGQIMNMSVESLQRIARNQEKGNNSTKFKCLTCDKESYEENSIFNHVKDKHVKRFIQQVKDEESYKKFKCSICGKVFRKEIDVFQHTRDEHVVFDYIGNKSEITNGYYRIDGNAEMKEFIQCILARRKWLEQRGGRIKHYFDLKTAEEIVRENLQEDEHVACEDEYCDDCIVAKTPFKENGQPNYDAIRTPCGSCSYKCCEACDRWSHCVIQMIPARETDEILDDIEDIENPDEQEENRIILHDAIVKLEEKI